MYAYVDEHFSTEETLGGLLGSAFEDTGDLPPFLQAQVLFGYLGGEQFVSELLRRAGGRWELVNTAFEVRPPSSTEQVLHPRAYFEADEPQPVRLRGGPRARRGMGAGAGRHVGRAADARDAPRRRARGRGGLGRRSLRAVAARRRARADHALALGHAA